MARLNRARRLDSQTLMFDEIRWEIREEFPLVESSGSTTSVRGAPSGNRAGIVSDDEDYPPPEDSRPPYWEFDYSILTSQGLKLTNVNARDTYSAGALEHVFEFIDFTDLEVEFTDGTTVPFDLASAFSSGSAIFTTAENGARTTLTPNDPLFQRGLKLTIEHNVLAGIGGTCDVTVHMSVVFRGAANDFDPGGVPVALDLWPQLGFSWSNDNATKFVRRFRGTVRYLLINKMSPTGTMMVMNANSAGYFTDSNESFNDGRADDDMFRAWFGSFPTIVGFAGMPFGWRMVFDYLTANLTQEKEITGVYGPNDGNKFRQSGTSLRRQRYRYPATSPYRVIVHKRDRQGDFDNTHTHAKMMPDSCGNIPVHAPFCGHSCIHLHWRWAALAVDGAGGSRGWQFKGWSSDVISNSRITAIVNPTAYSTSGAPLIPPNQKLKHAMTSPTHTRFSDDHIINPSSPGALDPLRKLNWYSVDIFNPAANQTQVVFEQGMGWAYRYATPDEASAVDGLTDAINDSLPWTGRPTQQEMAEFFDIVYERFRYFDGLLQPHVASCVDQVPDGSYSVGGSVSMEDL